MPLTATNFLKPLIPKNARSLLRDRQRRFLFDRALKKFARDPLRWSYAASPVLADLIRGWQNEGWSAQNGFLVACLQHALTNDGPILECGSGLTTILVGLISESRGNALWSLEHIPDWAVRVDQKLQELRVHCVHQVLRPLRSYSNFSWYDPPLQTMPDFSLVICDGPPADTPGGRYGLVPVMKHKFRLGTRILLDDASREEEQAIAKRWAVELGADYHILGSDAPYIILTIPATGQPHAA